jgi:hypothetical protein
MLTVDRCEGMGLTSGHGSERPLAAVESEDSAYLQTLQKHTRRFLGQVARQGLP